MAACRHAVAGGDAEVAVAAYRAAWEVLDLRGPFALGVELGASVIALEESGSASRAVALVTRATALRRAGRMDEAQASLARALAVTQAAKDRGSEGIVRLNLGTLHAEQGQAPDAARAELEAALTIHREVGNRSAEGVALATLINLDLDMVDG